MAVVLDTLFGIIEIKVMGLKLFKNFLFYYWDIGSHVKARC